MARSIGADPVVFTAPGTLNLEEPPTAIVVELEMEEAIDAIVGWKARWPLCVIAGCALVSNRGALDQQLKRKIEELTSGGQGSLTWKTLLPLLGVGYNQWNAPYPLETISALITFFPVPSLLVGLAASILWQRLTGTLRF